MGLWVSFSLVSVSGLKVKTFWLKRVCGSLIKLAKLINDFYRLHSAFKKFAGVKSKCAFQPLRTAISVEECLHEASEYLANYRSTMTGPAIVLAESPLDLNHLTSTMQTLHDLPVILIRANENDSRYPALNWQQYSVERMVQRYLLSHAYYYDRLACSQYSHIPVGNMSFDFACDMADVFMARMLRANKHYILGIEKSKA